MHRSLAGSGPFSVCAVRRVLTPARAHSGACSLSPGAPRHSEGARSITYDWSNVVIDFLHSSIPSSETEMIVCTPLQSVRRIPSYEDNLWRGPARLLAVRARLRARLDEPDTHELRIELVGGSMRSDWRRALWAFGRTRHPSRRRHPKLQVFRRLLVGAEDHSGPHGGGSVLNAPCVHHPRADLVRRGYRERQMAAARARAPGGITHRVGG